MLALLIAMAGGMPGAARVQAEMSARPEAQSKVADGTADEAASADPGDDMAADARDGVRFFSDRTVVRLGRVGSVPMRVVDVAQADRVLDAVSSDESVLRVVTPPRVLAGMDEAYVLVEPRKTGTARLRVGDAAIEVAVASPTMTVDHAPTIVGPVEGSYVWGEIAVGVECEAEQADALRLVLPDGRRIKPDDELSNNTAPIARMVFVVDCDRLPAGAAALTAVVESDSAPALRSASRRVHVVQPDEAALIAGEAEDEIDNPRPEAFSQNRPSTGSQASASAGEYVRNYSRDPEWCLVRELERAGWYQLILRVRGDEAVALPSVGLSVNNERDPMTGTRLMSRDWHRVPVGQPIFLEAGEQTLTAIFLNDFHVAGLADRNLYIDRFELLRVAPQGGGEAVAGGAMMMAASDAMMTGGTMMMAESAMMSAGSGSDASADAAVLQADDATEIRQRRALANLTEEGALHPRLVVAFERPIDRQLVTGRVEIKAYTWWHEPRENPAPTITMVVNGQPHASQVAADPLFWLDRAALKPGVNTVLLLATLPTGATAWTPIQRLIVQGDVDANDKPRRMVRFPVLDPRWGDSWGDRLTDQDRVPGYKVAAFHSRGKATLTLPEDLAGEFNLQLHVRADEFEGQPQARVTLEVEGQAPRVIEQNCWGWWNLREFGHVTLPAGPKTLSVDFINDHYVEGKGDRNLYLWAVQLVERDDRADRIPPQVTLVHPADGSEGFQADVAVVEAFDDTRLAHVDLLIDGEPQRIAAGPGQGTGRFTLPILLRDLPPGEHTLRVRAEDHQQNVGMSEAVTYTVLADPPAQLTAYERAVRLLNRFGYGPEPAELAAVLAMGERAYLEDRLARHFDTPGERAALANAFARHREDHNYAVTQRATQQLLLTDNPVRMRFVLWAQNHFSTWINKTQGAAKWQEHVRFSQFGAAPFGELLHASATSPAMLHYLDQTRSFRGRINENYAREIMELHTLGVDAGYAQQDVTALARLLTGWTVANEAGLHGQVDLNGRRGYVFRFDASLNDPEPLTLMGLPLDRADHVEQQHDRVRQGLAVLASHPAAARFVSRKLAEHYVGVPASDELVDDLAAVYLRTGGEMRELLLAIAVHPAFGERELPMKVCTPMDFAVRAVRVTGNASADWAVRECAYRSGAGLFDRATPDGYPEDNGQYATSNTLMQRWQFARRLEWSLINLVPGPWRGTSEADHTWRQQVTDAAAVQLTGQLLSEASNQAALDLLAATELTDHRRILLLTTFIAQLPEANMR